jgi:hypothetical protein
MIKEEPLKFGSASLYKMKIQGRISESWTDQIGPIRISQELISDGLYITTILFNTKDQAELFGFINTIQKMHLPLLSLERVVESKPTKKHTNKLKNDEDE